MTRPVVPASSSENLPRLRSAPGRRLAAGSGLFALGLALGLVVGPRASGLVAGLATVATGHRVTRGHAGKTADVASSPGVEPESAADQPSRPVPPLTLAEARAKLDLALAAPGRKGREEILADLCDGLESDDAAVAVTWTERLPTSTQRKTLTDCLIRRWAETNPRAALAHAQTLANRQSVLSTTTLILYDWAAEDCEAATTWALAQPRGVLRGEALGAVAGALADEDPARALALTSEVSPEQANAIVSMVFQKWADADPEEASRRFNGLTDEVSRMAAVGPLADAMARNDPHAAAAWARRLPRGRIAVLATERVVAGMVDEDPAAAADLAQQTEHAGQGSYLVGMTISRWAARDPDAALEWTKSLPAGQQRQEAMAVIAARLADQDPARGIRLLEEMPPGAAREQAVSQVAMTYAEVDIQQALKWAASLKDGPDRSTAMTALAREWAYTDPKAAAAAASDLPPGDSLVALVYSVSESWAHQAPREALLWADGLKNDRARSDAVSTICRTWSETEPWEAARYLEQLPNSDVRESAVEQLVPSWSMYDPASAGAWVRDSLSGDGQARAIDSVVAQWTNLDAAAAGLWVESLPQGATRDRGLEALSRNLAMDDPRLAMQWAMAVNDGKARDAAVRAVFENWRATSGDDARDWLASAALPEPVRQMLAELDLESIDAESGEQDDGEDSCHCHCRETIY
jgi:hypothetical protein